MGVLESIQTANDALTAAERRVAVAVTDDPQGIAFGTMADLVERSGSGAATIARLCGKLGFDGFSSLQRAIQEELVAKLRPAAHRIRESSNGADGGTDLLDQIAAMESANLASTFAEVDPQTFAKAVALLADPKRHVVVLASDACVGVGLQFRNELSLLRANVELLDGNPVTVARRVALADRSDVVVAIDYRRYDQWLVATAQRFVAAEAAIVSVSDSALSPLAVLGPLALVTHAQAPGPFDSVVSTLALLGALSAGVAAKSRRAAAERLSLVEAAWTDADVLRDV